MSYDLKYPQIGFVPAYPDIVTYANLFGNQFMWDGDPWYETCRSWAESSYIHTGISGFEFVIKGPDAQKLISDIAINNVYKWKINRCKHIVECNEEGIILNHALFTRDAEDTYRTYSGCTFNMEKVAKEGKYDVEITFNPIFVFQFSGPLSLTIVEKVVKQNLHDVVFLETRPVAIPGLEGQFEVCRIGMSGTLAYEIRGPKDLGPYVYDMAYEAGKDLGLKRLGWKDYVVNHTYGGYPQMNCTFTMGMWTDPDFAREALFPLSLSGSVEPENLRARLRTPGEVDWMWMADFNHEFKGKAALEKELKDPTKKIVSLVWNVEDILDIQKSLYTEEEPYKVMDYPCMVPQPCGGHADYVTTKDGKKVGIASCAAYSSYYHVMLCHATIDADQAFEGNELYVQWGDYGKKIKNVRVVVAKYPFNKLQENKGFDLSKVPYGYTE